jgi:hypothetical protein
MCARACVRSLAPERSVIAPVFQAKLYLAITTSKFESKRNESTVEVTFGKNPRIP